MPAAWADVDTLIGELGAVRAAAFTAHASAAAYAAIEQAMSEATHAVLNTLDAPQDAPVFARAHEAIAVVSDVIEAFDEQIEHSLRVRAGATELRGRAQELVEQARKAQRAMRA